MRTGLVTLYYPPLVRGGAHLSVYYIAKGLADKGHEVHVFTAAPPGLPVKSKQWEHPNIHRHAIFPIQRPATAWGQDYASLRMALYLRRYLKRESLHLDVLHAYGMDTIPAVVVNQRYGHTVATFNGYWATCPSWDHTDPTTLEVCPTCGYSDLGSCVGRRGNPHTRLRRLVKWNYLYGSLRMRQHYARKLELIMPISQSVRAILLQSHFASAKMRVCYNMVDLSAYRKLDRRYLHRRFGLPQSRRVLLHAGRFAPYKGSRYILRAAPDILRHHRDAHFVLVGQGSELPNLEAQVEEMCLRDNVTLGAFIDPLEMPHAYASSYAFLHTSTWPEPFARGPVEALAAGTAVIATSTGGTPEIIRNEVTGLLVPPDDPQAISEACNRLLSDAPLLRRLGETGRAEVQARFDIKVQIECYVAAYQRVL